MEEERRECKICGEFPATNLDYCRVCFIESEMKGIKERLKILEGGD